jgi:hypothetical protein
MTTLTAARKYPNALMLTNILETLLWCTLGVSAGFYYEIDELGKFFQEWGPVFFVYGIGLIMRVVSLAEIQVRVHNHQLEIGTKYPLLPKLKKCQVFFKKEIKEITVEQDSDLFFQIVIITQSGARITLPRKPNWGPLIREFNETLEKENWNEHKLNTKGL